MGRCQVLDDAGGATPTWPADYEPLFENRARDPGPMRTGQSNAERSSVLGAKTRSARLFGYRRHAGRCTGAVHNASLRPRRTRSTSRVNTSGR